MAQPAGGYFSMEMRKSPVSGGSDMSPPSSHLLQTDRHDADGHLDSSCSTPYVSAPSSPGRGSGPLPSFFFSAPASPMHFILSSSASLPYPSPPLQPSAAADLPSEFDFSSSLAPSSASAVGSMTSADKLFHNGQIRPMVMEQQNPQALPPPTLDFEGEDDESNAPPAELGRDSWLRSRSVHRRVRSMSPTRKKSFEWQREEDDNDRDRESEVSGSDLKQPEETEASTASVAARGSASAPTSRSSSVKGSKRWISLKDFLYRSKSEGRGRGNGKEKFWHTLSFSPSTSSREKKSEPPMPEATARGEKEKGKSQLPPKVGKGTAGKGSGNKRRGPAPSPHEALYTANRAQAEEMKKKTFLPYKQGLLGCLGFSSKSYGAWNGFAKTLNPISSR